MAHGRFNRRKDHVESDIDQVDAGQRNHQIAADDNALVENVIQDVDERELILAALVREKNCARRRTHTEPALSLLAERKE